MTLSSAKDFRKSTASLFICLVKEEKESNQDKFPKTVIT